MSYTDSLSDNAAAVLARFPGPVTLRQTRLIWIVVFVLSSIATIYLISILWPFVPNLTTKGALLLGVLLAIFWVPLATVAPICLAKGLPKLVLDAEGFEIQHLFGVRRKRWLDVARFSPFLLIVLYRYPAPARGFWKKVNRELFLPAYYGLGARGLACLMTAWRERALPQNETGSAAYGSSSLSQ